MIGTVYIGWWDGRGDRCIFPIFSDIDERAYGISYMVSGVTGVRGEISVLKVLGLTVVVMYGGKGGGCEKKL